MKCRRGKKTLLFYLNFSFDAYIAGESRILLQCRVGDETFIETMNIGSSFMHDDITIEAYEEYEEIDEEG
jgi:hypothetical protein